MFSVIRVLLSKFKLPEEEIDDFIREIKEVKNVGGWFEHFEGFDLPAERKKMREELEKEIKEELEKEIKEELEKEIKEELEKEHKEEWHEKEFELYIKAFKEIEMPKEEVAQRVVIKFLLNLKEAESKVEQYW